MRQTIGEARARIRPSRPVRPERMGTEMTDLLHLCLYDPTDTIGDAVRTSISKSQNVLLAGEASKWETFKACVKQVGAEVLLVNLDTSEGLDLEPVERATHLWPSCSIIGISSHMDPPSIISAMRAGCSQFVCAPVEAEDLRQAIARIQATRFANISLSKKSKRVCVIGSSGGVGTTTIACNLAMELAHLSARRCALIDMNLELGDVGCVFDCTPKFSVADVCQTGVEIDCTLLRHAMHDLPCSVSVLTRPEKLEDAQNATPEGIQNMFTGLAEMFPYIVADLPRTFNARMSAAVRDADLILIVSQLGVSSIRNAERVYQGLLQMDVADENIQIVLNRCKSTFERISPDDVETHFGKPVFAMIPNDYHRVQNSLDVGHPIVADAPDAPARLAIQAIARKIACTEQVGELAASGGLLAKLWSRSRKSK
jgi:pilus assembly protein CpaE